MKWWVEASLSRDKLNGLVLALQYEITEAVFLT
jgi:hypothetical protein